MYCGRLAASLIATAYEALSRNTKVAVVAVVVVVAEEDEAGVVEDGSLVSACEVILFGKRNHLF